MSSSFSTNLIFTILPCVEVSFKKYRTIHSKQNCTKAGIFRAQKSPSAHAFNTTLTVRILPCAKSQY